MIKALIIDDEPKSRSTLYSLLAKYCNGISISAEPATIAQALQAVSDYKPELVFLDASTPESKGFEFLTLAPTIDFEVIFTAENNGHALNAIRANALDYLLKPLIIPELQRAVQKAIDRVNEKMARQKADTLLRQISRANNIAGKIAVPVNDGLHFINTNQIVRLEANGSYTKICCADKTSMLSSRPLRDYEELLDSTRFFRAHHSHIINLSHIVHYHRGEGGYVTMADGSVIDISKRKKKDFLDIFHY